MADRSPSDYLDGMSTRTREHRTEMLVEVVAGGLRCGDVRIPLRPREAEIIVLLALQPSPSDTATLTTLLYPDRDTGDAKNMLKVSICRIRGRLGRDFIVFRDGGYRLREDVRVDLDECRAAALAVSRRHASPSPEERKRLLQLARGLRGTPPAVLMCAQWYERFERAARRAGRDLPITLARVLLDENALDEVLAIAAEIADEDACDEEAWELVIRAELLLGRRGTALRSFRTYEAVVSKELGVIPSSFLVRLVSERHDAAAV
jgi:DNA-binding SARP family transcriptional activator